MRGINEAFRREMVAADVVLAIPDSDTLGKYRVQQTRRSASKTKGKWVVEWERGRGWCYRGLRWDKVSVVLWK